MTASAGGVRGGPEQSQPTGAVDRQHPEHLTHRVGAGENQQAAAIDEARRTATVTVRDAGVGIPAKDLPFVFDTFYRVSANNRRARGTGLGLPLVKHIVEHVHPGRVFDESAIDEGSTFGFELQVCDE